MPRKKIHKYLMEEGADPILRHEQELKHRDTKIRQLTQQLEISRSQYCRADEILSDFTNVLSDAADALRQTLSPRGGDPSTSAAAAEACDRVLRRRMDQVNKINEHVTTMIDELALAANADHITIRNLRQQVSSLETWRTRLPEWQLAIEDNVYRLTHFRYSTVFNADFTEAIETALKLQEADSDHHPQET